MGPIKFAISRPKGRPVTVEVDEETPGGGYYVYCLWGEHDRSLYVGMTSNLLGRLGQHMSNPDFGPLTMRITATACRTSKQARALEARTIRKLQPAQNTHGKPKPERKKRPHGSGSVRFRAGAWRVQTYSVADGRFVHRTVRAPNTAAGRREAEAAARKLYDEHHRKAIPPDTFGMLVERWTEHRRDEWGERNTKWTRQIMDNRVLPHLGTTRLADLSPADIDACYRTLRKRGLSASTIHRTHNAIHAALEQAVRWDFIDRNPADRVSLPRQRAPRKATLPTPDLLRSVIAVADPMMAVVIRLGVHTGARTGELVLPKWTDLDVDEGLWVKLWQPKTQQEKVLALGPKTAEVMRDWRAKVDEIHRSLYGEALGDWWLFPSPRRPTHHLTASAVSHGWSRLCAQAGVPYMPFKMLRKTMSTVCLSSGIDVRTVMGRGGWSAGTIEPGAAVMLRHYAQMVTEADRRAAKVLDDWLDS